jgi:hypothetical protein
VVRKCVKSRARTSEVVELCGDKSMCVFDIDELACVEVARTGGTVSRDQKRDLPYPRDGESGSGKVNKSTLGVVANERIGKWRSCEVI